jgi:hypothetical protein
MREFQTFRRTFGLEGLIRLGPGIMVLVSIHHHVSLLQATVVWREDRQRFSKIQAWVVNAAYMSEV